MWGRIRHTSGHSNHARATTTTMRAYICLWCWHNHQGRACIWCFICLLPSMCVQSVFACFDWMVGEDLQILEMFVQFHKTNPAQQMQIHQYQCVHALSMYYNTLHPTGLEDIWYYKTKSTQLKVRTRKEHGPASKLANNSGVSYVTRARKKHNC